MHRRWLGKDLILIYIKNLAFSFCVSLITLIVFYITLAKDLTESELHSTYEIETNILHRDTDRAWTNK